MLHISIGKTVYQKATDKNNDNVICYAFSEVVLCR